MLRIMITMDGNTQSETSSSCCGTKPPLEKIKFERKLFIRDLYQAEHFLNSFDMITFQNIKAFMSCYEQNYLELNNVRIIIYINNQNEFDAFKKIIGGSDMDKLISLAIVLFDEELLQQYDGIENKKFITILESACDLDKYSRFAFFHKYKQNNPIYIKVKITFQNINTIFEEVLDQYMKNYCRYFIFDFDYLSFQDAKLSDLSMIYFKINRFLSFRLGTKKKGRNTNTNTNTINNELVFFYSHKLKKKIFISDNLSLFYNEKHFKEEKLPQLFKLTTENDIPFTELNRVRQYIDLKSNMIIPRGTRNFDFFDPYQNSLINGVLLELPFISQLVMEWMS